MTIVIFNNGGIYRGDGVDLSGAGAPSPTDLLHHARYDKLMDAFRGVGYNVTTTDELRHALTTGIQSRKPTIINVVIDLQQELKVAILPNLTQNKSLVIKY